MEFKLSLQQSGTRVISFEYVRSTIWLITPPRDNSVVRYVAEIVSGVLL